ncbi:MAG: hypothetical protein ACRDZ3_12545 [Acidimicrobiia bacterium]
MISQGAFDSLRMAATLALAVPTVGVRISTPVRPLIDVSWMPPQVLLPGTRHMAPCLFRRCIGCAHHRRQAGESVTLWGMPEGADPTVEVLISPGDRKLPAGIYQTRVEGGWRIVFPCLLAAPRCAELLGIEWPELNYHADPLTGVTLVSCRRTEVEGPLTGRRVERLLDARARLLVDELMHEVTSVTRS